MIDRSRHSHFERDTSHGRNDSYQPPLDNSQRIVQLLNERRLRRAAQSHNHGHHLEIGDYGASAAPHVERHFNGQFHHSRSHHSDHHQRSYPRYGHQPENYYAQHKSHPSGVLGSYADGVVDHGVGKCFAKAIEEGYYTNPLHVRQSLIKGNYKVIATDDVRAYDRRYHTNLSNTQPSGYEKGKTFRSAVAWCDHNTKSVVMPEHYEPYGKRVASIDHRDIRGTLRHEIGHAYDFLNRGLLRDNPEVRRIYEEEKKALTGHLRPKNSRYRQHVPQYDSQMVETSPAKSLRYYLEPGSGLGETIAELYAIRHGGGSDTKNNDRLLAQSFNKLMDYLKRHNI